MADDGEDVLPLLNEILNILLLTPKNKEQKKNILQMRKTKLIQKQKDAHNKPVFSDITTSSNAFVGMEIKNL